ncbi:disease resistance protein RPV1-like [Cornus florida]|uniref:disease resistance protein RPV1-like n=1 Tax=Cornus florida TaxID=4283 RepID=UPI00289A9D71|nr:disease resistance protein RPV1-like [Cornus florida]
MMQDQSFRHIPARSSEFQEKGKVEIDIGLALVLRNSRTTASGETQKTFADHLYTALLHAGIRTFRDDDGVRRGDHISIELIKAIKESSISIIVFSKNYASSRWCLDELLKIMERKKTVGHMIFPVFYHVDPSDVRKQTGSFAISFAKHKERFMAEMDKTKEDRVEKIKKWKEALSEVEDLAGLILKDG